MMLWIKNKRKDGKYTVVYGFNNGKRITKIITKDKLEEDLKKSENN